MVSDTTLISFLQDAMELMISRKDELDSGVVGHRRYIPNFFSPLLSVSGTSRLRQVTHRSQSCSLEPCQTPLLPLHTSALKENSQQKDLSTMASKNSLMDTRG